MFCAGAATIALTVSGLGGASTAGAAPVHPARPSAPAPRYGILKGVAASSASNAWAIGYTGSGLSMIVHWNGRAWKRVTIPVYRGDLHGIATTSARSAWAVGDSGILHWNGRSWKRWRSPALAGEICGG